MNIETACIVPPVHIGCEDNPSYWDSHVRGVGQPAPPLPLCEKKRLEPICWYSAMWFWWIKWLSSTVPQSSCYKKSFLVSLSLHRSLAWKQRGNFVPKRVQLWKTSTSHVVLLEPHIISSWTFESLQMPHNVDYGLCHQSLTLYFTSPITQWIQTADNIKIKK